jgi:RHS repeat-associated protein
MAAEPSMGRAFFVLTDQVGAPLRVEDEQGHEVWRARMQPFGRVEVEAGSAIELSLRFPGHLHDPETGLHHNRFRYYDPRLGRYLQPDPMGVMGGLNVYQYCPSPSSTVDLDGLMEAGTHAHHGGAPPLVHGRDHLSWGAWARSWGTWAQSYVDRARGFASRMRRTRSQLDELLETPTIGQSVDLVPGTDTVKRPLYIRRSRGTTSRGEPYDDVALTTYDPTELYPAELYPDATIRSQVVLFTPMRPTDGIERGTPLHRFDGPGAEGVTAWATPGQTGCSVLIVQWPDGKYSMAHLQPPSDDAAQEWALHHRGLEIDIDDDVQRGAIKDAMLREELQALVAASQAGGGPPERHILVQTMSREMAEGGGIQVLGLPDAGGGWAFSYKHVDDESTTILEWSDGGP